MKFSNIINSIIITVAVVFLVALAFHVRTGATADSIAVLKTAGMTCGSCSSKITAALRNRKALLSPRLMWKEAGWSWAMIQRL